MTDFLSKIITGAKKLNKGTDMAGNSDFVSDEDTKFASCQYCIVIPKEFVNEDLNHYRTAFAGKNIGKDDRFRVSLLNHNKFS